MQNSLFRWSNRSCSQPQLNNFRSNIPTCVTCHGGGRRPSPTTTRLRTSNSRSWVSVHELLITMLAKAQNIIRSFNAGECVYLLPALLAMRDLTAAPGRRKPNGNSIPDWTEESYSLGLNPDVVRQWKCRTAAEYDIRHLLGEEPSTPKASDAARNAEAVKHLRRLVQAVLNGGDARETEKLAQALAERHGF